MAQVTIRVTEPNGDFRETVENIPNSSVEITMNAKGLLQYSAKLYFTAEDCWKAPDTVRTLTDSLDRLYAGRLAKPEAAK